MFKSYRNLFIEFIFTLQSKCRMDGFTKELKKYSWKDPAILVNSPLYASYAASVVNALHHAIACNHIYYGFEHKLRLIVIQNGMDHFMIKSWTVLYFKRWLAALHLTKGER